VRTVAANTSFDAEGTVPRIFRMVWTMQRCQDAPLTTRAIEALQPGVGIGDHETLTWPLTAGGVDNENVPGVNGRPQVVWLAVGKRRALSGLAGPLDGLEKTYFSPLCNMAATSLVFR
jgi:hypothetical protein